MVENCVFLFFRQEDSFRIISARHNPPFLFLMIKIGDLPDIHLEVLALTLDGHGSVCEEDLAGSLKGSLAVADNPPYDPDLPIQGHRFAKTHGKIDRHPPDIVRISLHDGPADGLIQNGRGNAPVQTPGISLVLRGWLENSHDSTAFQLIKATLQAESVLQTADKAHL